MAHCETLFKSTTIETCRCCIHTNAVVHRDLSTHHIEQEYNVLPPLVRISSQLSPPPISGNQRIATRSTEITIPLAYPSHCKTLLLTEENGITSNRMNWLKLNPTNDNFAMEERHKKNYYTIDSQSAHNQSVLKNYREIIILGHSQKNSPLSGIGCSQPTASLYDEQGNCNPQQITAGRTPDTQYLGNKYYLGGSIHDFTHDCFFNSPPTLTTDSWREYIVVKKLQELVLSRPCDIIFHPPTSFKKRRLGSLRNKIEVNSVLTHIHDNLSTVH